MSNDDRNVATGEQVLCEIADLIDRRLPSIPDDDPYRSALASLRAAAPRDEFVRRALLRAAEILESEAEHAEHAAKGSEDA